MNVCDGGMVLSIMIVTISATTISIALCVCACVSAVCSVVSTFVEEYHTLILVLGPVT